jgi:hypothetical protein
MLNFLNTAVLAAAAAAILPLVLHLFSRRKVKVVPFSSVTFLKAMQKRQVRAIKIKQILLLVIRTLIILAVVLAFARPATRGGYLGTHATVSAVIVLDNSASMGLSVRDGRLFDLAIRKARRIIDQMEQSDEVAVMTTSGDYSALSGDNIFGNPAAAKEFVADIGLTDNRADLSEIYSQAVRLLAERPNLNREIYIISDCQEISISPEQVADEFEGKSFLVDLPVDDIDNSGLVGVDFGNQLIEVGTEIIVDVTARRMIGNGSADILVSLYLDDKRVAQDALRLKPGETGEVSFPMTVTNPGFHSGYALLSDDDLTADNIHYFSFYIPEQFSVLLVGEETVGTDLLRLALAPDENTRRHWSVNRATYTSFSSVRPSEYDVIMLADYSSISSGDMARLKEYVRRGGGLWINTGQSLDSARYTEQVEELTGVRLLSGFPSNFSRGGYYLLTDFDLDHQILSVLKEDNNGEPLSARAYTRIKTEPVPDIEMSILAKYSDGSPAMATRAIERGRVMMFNCPLSPEISDISLHPFFVPLIVRSCEYLSSDYSAHTESLPAGSSPERTLRKSFNVKNEFTLVSPDGFRSILSARFKDGERIVECQRLDKSGVYAIFNGTAESDRFAINIDPEEGDFYRSDFAALQSYFHNAEDIPYGADMAGFISEKRFGRELWHFFVLAAILLLILEMIVARDRGAPISSEE